MGHCGNRRYGVLMAGAFTAAARGQIGTGLLQWQVSADDGATWSAGLLEAPLSQSSVKVRAMASWTADAGYVFAMVRMDIVWHSEGAGGLLDELADLQYNPRLQGTVYPIGATRFGPSVKIDDLRDTLPPGEGPRGVNIGQVPEGMGIVDRSNPIELFRYSVLLDGTPGDRRMTSYFIAPFGSVGNTVDRFMLIYVNYQGATNIPLSTLETATLRVVPTPGALAGFGLFPLLAARRRRGRPEQ